MIDILIYFGILYLSIIAIYSLAISWKVIKSLGFTFWAVGEFLLTFTLIALCPIMGFVYPIWGKLYEIRRNRQENRK